VSCSLEQGFGNTGSPKRANGGRFVNRTFIFSDTQLSGRHREKSVQPRWHEDSRRCAGVIDSGAGSSTPLLRIGARRKYRRFPQYCWVAARARWSSGPRAPSAISSARSRRSTNVRRASRTSRRGPRGRQTCDRSLTPPPGALPWDGGINAKSRSATTHYGSGSGCGQRLFVRRRIEESFEPAHLVFGQFASASRSE